MSSSPKPSTEPAETLASWHEWVTRKLHDAFEAGGEDGYNQIRAWLGRNDLMYLLVHLCGRRDMLHPWVFARVREVEAKPNGCLDLWARTHFKSSIITFGKTVQDILNDPEATFGIFSDVNKVAKPFLRQIKTEFETNTLLKALYHDVLWSDPRSQAPKWSEDDGIVVKRKGNPKEATVEAYGLIDGQPIGRHFSHRVYDDIVTPETVNTPEMMAKVWERFGLSNNLGTNNGIVRYVGTRYHANDAWSKLIATGTVFVRQHPATDNGKADGNPVLLTREQLAAKRQLEGAYVFGCQSLLDPTADQTMGFREENLRYWSGENQSNLAKVILVDPASKKKKASDYTAIWVLGFGSDRNWYECDFVYDKLNLPERVKTLMRLHREHGPIFVGYEEYGQQSDIEAIQWEQERTNYRFDIAPLGGKLAKADRILRLQPLFENRRIYLLRTLLRMNWERHMQDLTKVFVEQEYKAYPVAPHDDALDCLSRVCDEEVKTAAESNRPADTGAAAERDLEKMLDEYDVGAVNPSAWMGA